MKNQALFSSKDKSKTLKCRLLQFLFGALRVNSCAQRFPWHNINLLKEKQLIYNKTEKQYYIFIFIRISLYVFSTALSIRVSRAMLVRTKMNH